MKRTFIILYILISSFVMNANNISIQKIESNTTLYGTKYFPLFLGEEWIWKLSDSDNIASMKWYIASLCTIDDDSNNLSNTMGFKIDINGTPTEFYLIQANGFISSYEKKNGKYYVTQIFPSDPSSTVSWISGKDNYEVTLSNESVVKIEFSDEAGLKYGYQLFKKGIGPSEIFNYKKTDSGENSIKWELESHTSYDDINGNSEDGGIDFDETIDSNEVASTTTTTVPMDITKNETKTYDDSYLYTIIPELSEDTTYIQIGAYSSKENALILLNISIGAGYKTYIWAADSELYGKLYKVLIAVDPSEEKKLLLKVRNNIEKNAFIYSRAQQGME